MSTIIATKGYSIAEAARITGKHRNTIRNYINSGIIKAYEGRRNIRRQSNDEGQRKALLIKGIELTVLMNTY
mgnify:FL=1|jgi:transposase